MRVNQVYFCKMCYVKSKEKASKSLSLQEMKNIPVYAKKVLEVWYRAANSIETSLTVRQTKKKACLVIFRL